MSKSLSIWALVTHSGRQSFLKLPPHWFVGTSRRAEGARKKLIQSEGAGIVAEGAGIVPPPSPIRPTSHRGRRLKSLSAARGRYEAQGGSPSEGHLRREGLNVAKVSVWVPDEAHGGQKAQTADLAEGRRGWRPRGEARWMWCRAGSPEAY
ncbi:unnamed protein product [Gadus morhua 'NCC']